MAKKYALTGSTEWGEQYADELKQKAVAYLNVDEATSGQYFQGEAVGSLAPLLVDVSHRCTRHRGERCMTIGRLAGSRSLNAK